MSARQIEQGVWGLAIVFAAAGGIAVHHAANPPMQRRAEGLPASARPVELSQMTVDPNLTARDPFRVARHPTLVPYRPEMEGITPPPPPAKPPNPVLTLAGILGGPPWEALLEGVPDHPEAVVVREGDRLGDLRIKSVRRDIVVVTSSDTTWHLTIKRSWR